MYSILIVDDESASIKYIRNLIAGYLPEYQVVREAFSGQEAYAYLCERSVDVLITDARMPGMDGIELAKKARKLHASLKILVVSGFADFEYAKGALSAGVNEYLLKPLDIERVIEVMRGVAQKLDVEYEQARRAALKQLAAGKAVESNELSRLFNGVRCRVGLIRFGNLLPTFRGAASHGAMAEPRAEGLMFVPGRDDMEWIGVAWQAGADPFPQKLLRLAGDHLPLEIATIAYWLEERPLIGLHEAASALMRMLDERLVIGKGQLITVPPHGLAPEAELPVSELRKLDFCLQSGSLDLLKDTLFSWAVEWEKRAIPQRVLEALLWQIAERAMHLLPQAQARRHAIRSEVEELYCFARNVGELMRGFWDVLFAPLQADQHGRQPVEELIGEICNYVRERCTEPLTLPIICVQFGISQTYLSRLFRRFVGTTFNDYLTGCRLDLAKLLICQQPGVKLRDVALLSGYEDPSYFSKVFRQREGMTPQQFAGEQGSANGTRIDFSKR